MTESEIYDRAGEAAGVLQNAAFTAVFEEMDARMVKQWRAACDAEERERIFGKVEALAAVRRELVMRLEEAANHDGRKGSPDGFWRGLWNKFNRS